MPHLLSTLLVLAFGLIPEFSAAEDFAPATVEMGSRTFLVGQVPWQHEAQENFLRLCCTNPMRDSSRESSVVAGMHEQTRTPNLQHPELARL